MKKSMVGVSRRSLIMASAALAMPSIVRAQSAAPGKEPFTFGVALPTTGSAAPFGLDDVQALQFGVADINVGGGAAGRMLRPLVLDTQASPQVGIDAVTRMISVEKVPLISESFSAVVAATAPIMNRTKTLALATGAVSPRLATMGDYVYTTYPLSSVDATLMAKYGRQKLNATKAAVIYINDESGVYAAGIYRDAFKALGGQIVASESYEPNATDYTGAVLKIRVANPDVVHLQGNAGDSPQAIRQLRQLGVTQPITTYAAAYNPQILKQIGTQADGMYIATESPGVSDSPAVAKFVDRWRKEKGTEIANLPVNSYFYDVPYLVKALVEHVAASNTPITGESLRVALLAVKEFDLPLTGKVTFNDDHTVAKPVYVVGVKGGQYVPLGIFE